MGALYIQLRDSSSNNITSATDQSDNIAVVCETYNNTNTSTLM